MRYLLLFLCGLTVIMAEDMCGFGGKTPEVEITIHHGLINTPGGIGGHKVHDALEAFDGPNGGAYTVANLNDTDGDNIIDAEEDTDPNKDGAGIKETSQRLGIIFDLGRNEIDLMQLIIEKPDWGTKFDIFNISVIEGAHRIRFWKESTRKNLVKLEDLVWKWDEMPNEVIVWIEAIKPSTKARDIKIKANFKLGKSDVVFATSIWSKLVPKFGGGKGNLDNGAVAHDKYIKENAVDVRFDWDGDGIKNEKVEMTYSNFKAHPAWSADDKGVGNKKSDPWRWLSEVPHSVGLSNKFDTTKLGDAKKNNVLNTIVFKWEMLPKDLHKEQLVFIDDARQIESALWHVYIYYPLNINKPQFKYWEDPQYKKEFPDMSEEANDESSKGDVDDSDLINDRNEFFAVDTPGNPEVRINKIENKKVINKLNKSTLYRWYLQLSAKEFIRLNIGGKVRGNGVFGSRVSGYTEWYSRMELHHLLTDRGHWGGYLLRSEVEDVESNLNEIELGYKKIGGTPIPQFP